MSYETQLQFVEVYLRPHRVLAFMEAAETLRKDPNSEFGWMIAGIRLYSGGYLDWNLDKKGRRELADHCGDDPIKLSREELAEPDGPKIEFWFGGDWDPIGKWYDSKKLAGWLAPYCRSGKIIAVSQEGDGAIWGWEFSQRKGIRELGIMPTSEWRRPTAALYHNLFQLAKKIRLATDKAEKRELYSKRYKLLKRVDSNTVKGQSGKFDKAYNRLFDQLPVKVLKKVY